MIAFFDKLNFRYLLATLHRTIKRELVSREPCRSSTFLSLEQRKTTRKSFVSCREPILLAKMSCGDCLQADARINRGQRMFSANRALELVMQDDGNLVLYRRKDMHPLWASGTNGRGGEFACMQRDGNFVVYTGSGQPIWASQTHGKQGCRLVLQSDSNLVIYDCNNSPVWASNTHGKCQPGTQEMLRPGEKLLPGCSIHSANGQADLVMQGDGNLVLYRTRDGTPVWASQTHGHRVRELIMQHDGNLVIYDVNGKPIWASNTHGQQGAELKVQEDGNMCIYQRGNCVWASQTWGKCN